MANNKFRYFTMLLYPDNLYHQKIMEWFESEKSNFQGCYIKHDPDTETGKEHWHVLLYCQNPRTVSGLADSFGKADYRIYDDGRKEPCPDKTGVTDVVLPLPIVFYNEATPDRNNIGVCRDVCSWVTYMVHKDFKSQLLNKKEYQYNDIQAFKDDKLFIEHCFEVEKAEPKNYGALQVLELIEEHKIKDFRKLLRVVAENGDIALLKYVETHAYLIKNLLN